MESDAIRDVRHVKAARELLRWSHETLAEKAGLSIASVRRYEAAKKAIANSIEEDILAAFGKAGVVFVGEGEIADIDVSGGVLLRTSATPEAPTKRNVYVYAEGSSRGRPVGRVETSPRKPRAGRKRPPDA